MFAARVRSNSGIASPDAWIPKIALSWLVAMISPDAVMNPETTGCDRRFARKPSLRTPMSASISPESSARTSAAATNSGLPGGATALAAVSVISEMTATGPTARARLVPNSA